MSISEVWIIAKRQRETYGHGDAGQSWKLPTTGPYDSGPPHPAFPSQETADTYLKTLPHAFDLVALRLEFRV